MLGLSVDIDGFGVLPVRLGDDADTIAIGLQNAADDGMAEGRVVYIGVSDHINKVALRPTPIQHILFANRKKAHKEPPVVFCLLYHPI